MKTRLKKALIVSLLAASTSVLAEKSLNTPSKEAHPWSITTSLGLANYQHMAEGQGNTALGRVSFGNHMLSFGNSQLGLEIGLQSGNQMRFDIPKKTIDMLGGVPIVGTIQPALDLLLTLNTPLSTSLPLTGIIKGGLSYRQLRMDRIEIKDIGELSPEMQVGLGYEISNNLSINLVYQHLFGGNPNFTLNAMTETGVIAHIPSEDAVFLGLKFTF